MTVSYMWWTDTMNGLVLHPHDIHVLCYETLQSFPLISGHVSLLCGSEFSHVTCFGQWDIIRCTRSRGTEDNFAISAHAFQPLSEKTCLVLLARGQETHGRELSCPIEASLDQWIINQPRHLSELRPEAPSWDHPKSESQTHIFFKFQVPEFYITS